MVLNFVGIEVMNLDNLEIIMLLTLELMLFTNPKKTLLTLGELNISYGPELIEAIDKYVAQHATTPPGLWVRLYKGQHYLTQSVPALSFFNFLSLYEKVPIVGEFIEKNHHYVLPSKNVASEATFNVWIGRLDEPEAMAIAMPLTA